MSVTQMLNDVQNRMQKGIDHFIQVIARVRTGRAHPDLFSNIFVDCYGTSTPLLQLASVTTEGHRLLVVSPYDKSTIAAIEKAILTSDLGLNPSTNNGVLRIPLPPLTEESRKALTKLVRAEAEQAKVLMRSLRREANEQCKRWSKEKVIHEDEEKGTQVKVQKLTDQMVQRIDRLSQLKEKELMSL